MSPDVDDLLEIQGTSLPVSRFGERPGTRSEAKIPRKLGHGAILP